MATRKRIAYDNEVPLTFEFHLKHMQLKPLTERETSLLSTWRQKVASGLHLTEAHNPQCRQEPEAAAAAAAGAGADSSSTSSSSSSYINRVLRGDHLRRPKHRRASKSQEKPRRSTSESQKQHAFHHGSIIAVEMHSRQAKATINIQLEHHSRAATSLAFFEEKARREYDRLEREAAESRAQIGCNQSQHSHGGIRTVNTVVTPTATHATTRPPFEVRVTCSTSPLRDSLSHQPERILSPGAERECKRLLQQADETTKRPISSCDEGGGLLMTAAADPTKRKQPQQRGGGGGDNIRTVIPYRVPSLKEVDRVAALTRGTSGVTTTQSSSSFQYWDNVTTIRRLKDTMVM